MAVPAVPAVPDPMALCMARHPPMVQSATLPNHSRGEIRVVTASIQRSGKRKLNSKLCVIDATRTIFVTEYV